jgi:hypothetical protein
MKTPFRRFFFDSLETVGRIYRAGASKEGRIHFAGGHTSAEEQMAPTLKRGHSVDAQNAAWCLFFKCIDGAP